VNVGVIAFIVVFASSKKPHPSEKIIDPEQRLATPKILRNLAGF